MTHEWRLRKETWWPFTTRGFQSLQMNASQGQALTLYVMIHRVAASFYGCSLTQCRQQRQSSLFMFHTPNLQESVVVYDGDRICQRRNAVEDFRPYSLIISSYIGDLEWPVTLRYFTEFSKPTFQYITASICGRIYARVYCILHCVYDVVAKKVHVRYLIS